MSALTIDTTWYLTINHWARATPALHTPLAGYALWGGPLLLTGLLVTAWWFARQRGSAAVATTVLTGLGTITALLIGQDLISELIARARPCATLSGVQVLLPCSSDYSMPSDHAVIAGAIITGLWLSHRQLGIAATVVGVLLAWDRIYVGVHYPSDVLAGMMLGSAVALIMVSTLHRPATATVTALSRTRLSKAVSASGPTAVTRSDDGRC